MSFSDPTVYTDQITNGTDNILTVNFHYLTVQEIKVISYDITDPDKPVIVANEPYQIDNSNPPAQVVFDAPIPSNYRIVVYRDTATGQPSNFFTGKFPADAVEDTFDFLAQKIQENYEALENAGLTHFWDSIGGVGSPLYDIILGIVTGIAIESPVITSDASYNAKNQDVVIIPGSGACQVNLPVATADGTQVYIKVGDTPDNKTVVSTSGDIDGFGATYNFKSNYQALRFVYMSGAWYIL